MNLRTDDPSRRAQRVALSNHDLVRHVAAHLLAIASDWAMFVGALVYAFDQGGARATGLASVSLLMPVVLASLFTGTLATRFPPGRVRAVGFGVQAVSYGVAGAAAAAGAPTAAVIGAGMLGVGAVTTLKPTGATLLPAIVRSTRELGVGNLWTGYAENVGGLGGALVATGLLALGGAPSVIIGCAVMAAASAGITLFPRLVDPPGAEYDGEHTSVGRVVRNVRDLRSRPGVLGVLFVAGAQFFVVGALDIIVVVAAEERLGLGSAGPGVLLTLVGVGSIVGGVVSSVLIRLDRLAPLLIAAMLAIAVLAAAFGFSVTVIVAFISLPLIGVSRSVIDLIADVLLHRSAPPDVLASVYAVIEIASGVGLLLGSIGTQALLAASGLEAALFGIGAFFLLLVAVTIRPLRLADSSADVPVVSMSLIQRLPVFATLPRAELETLSRSAVEVATEPDEVIIREGDPGDRYYAVMSGSFDVTVQGIPVHRAVRGQGFGEVALLASVPRTAAVTSVTAGLLLAIDRTPFLIAITGHDATRQAAWGVAHSHGDYADPDLGPHEGLDAVTDID